MPPAQQPLLTLHACQGHLIGQCQGTGVSHLQTLGHLGSIIQWAAHLLGDLGVGERQVGDASAGAEDSGVQASMGTRKSPPPPTAAPPPPYAFGPEEWVLLDGPGGQRHAALADGSPDEALVVRREDLHDTQRCCHQGLASPVSLDSAKASGHVSSSTAPPGPIGSLPHPWGQALPSWGLQTCRETLAPPADSPKMVMLLGSPPKAAMFLFTHAMAMCWSRRP